MSKNDRRFVLFIVTTIMMWSVAIVYAAMYRMESLVTVMLAVLAGVNLLAAWIEPVNEEEES